MILKTIYRFLKHLLIEKLDYFHYLLFKTFFLVFQNPYLSKLSMIVFFYLEKLNF